jgi:hypothetical protein
MCGGKELKPDPPVTGDFYEVTKDNIEINEKDHYYSVLVAELTSWVDTNGNTINLKAYYPIPRASN